MKYIDDKHYVPYKTKPTFHISLKTGNKFPYKKYASHGKGGIYQGYEDLPKDEYPYTLEYEKVEAWLHK